MATPRTYQNKIRNFERRVAEMGLKAEDFKGKSVLDLGCNAGNFCGLAARWDASRVVGIDIDPLAVQASREMCADEARPPEFYQADLNGGLRELIPCLGIEPFDVIFCLSIFKYLNPKRLLEVIGFYGGGRCFLELNPVRRQFHDGEFLADVMPMLPDGTSGRLACYTHDRRVRPVFVFDFPPLSSARERFRAAPDRRKIGVGTAFSGRHLEIEALQRSFRNGCRLVAESEIFLVSTSSLALYSRRRTGRGLPTWRSLPEIKRRLTGDEKWRFLTRSIRDYGWTPDQPACLAISGDGIRLANGHHRVAIAAQLGIPHIPCCVLYHDVAET